MADEKIELGTTIATEKPAVQAEVKVEAKPKAEKPAPAPKTETKPAAVPTLTLTAPKAAKKLESHFKGYAMGKKITVTVKDDDTLVLTGEVTAETKTYALRYSDVTKAE